MIKILTKGDRSTHSDLFFQMHSGRAATFHTRLGWSVENRDGLEIDHFDDEAEPVYIVALDLWGKAVGSLRILPTNGPILLKSEFAAQFHPKFSTNSDKTWECSRFCVHAKVQAGCGVASATSDVSARLLIALCHYSLDAGIDAIVGFFDPPMVRVYRRIGWQPAIVAQSSVDPGLVVGRWSVTHQTLENMHNRIGSRSGTTVSGEAKTGHCGGAKPAQP